MPDETIEQEITDLQTEEEKVETEIAATTASASESPLERRVAALEALLEKHGIRQAE